MGQAEAVGGYGLDLVTGKQGDRIATDRDISGSLVGGATKQSLASQTSHLGANGLLFLWTAVSGTAARNVIGDLTATRNTGMTKLLLIASATDT